MKDQKTEELLYQPEQGINVLQKYMEMFGFHEASGIEITENPPQMADEFPVTAAIGQSNHNYTTTQLARYASVLANHGTLHNPVSYTHLRLLWIAYFILNYAGITIEVFI